MMKSGHTQSSKKYFLICASKDHVLKGVEGGFAQAGHGRKDLMSKPSKGDRIVYYSSKDKFENGKSLQTFTDIGEIIDSELYQPNTISKLKPYRRDVKYDKSVDAEIRPLIEKLSFIKNKKRWGFYLISGFREISKGDFEIIQQAMK
ncbi:MAG TPA: EVE domain-containing protein [Chitinophagaceae bacterium]|nr:EVE domain-containing protein [Chitinophagaceae bacterium]